MTVWEAAVLGFVQGATEFLPVSSSGHLVITQSVLGRATQGVLFEVAVHVATLVSILIVYRARIARIARGVLERDREALAYVGQTGRDLPMTLLGMSLTRRLRGCGPGGSKRISNTRCL